MDGFVSFPHSQTTCAKLDALVETAQATNESLNSELSTVGFSKRPTVAEWLHAKQEANRRSLQNELMAWDR